MFEALKDAGAKLNRDKYEFEVQKLKFPDHALILEGIMIGPDEVIAIDRIKTPFSKKDFVKGYLECYNTFRNSYLTCQVKFTI